MKPFTENTLILVDGSYYLHRAYHAFPPLTNSMGEPTGAMYGVLNMIRRLLIQYHSTHVVILFDADGKTFRNDLFEHYKSHRAKIPDDLKQQIGPLYEIVKAMGLPLLSINYVEADDVIGTLALSAEREGRDVLIITDDKDLTQLVSPNITLVNTRFNLIFDPKVVQIKFGVPPELIPDYLALTGDQSDNIPGVPGVGKKTAIALLQALGGLRSVYRHLDKISTLKFRCYDLANILKKHRDTAFLSYELAKIKTDVPLNFSYTQCTVKAPNIHTLFLLFQRYEFQHWSKLLKCRESLFLGKFDHSSTLLKKNGNGQDQEIDDTPTSHCHIIHDVETLSKYVTRLYSTGFFVFDIDTDKMDANPFTTNLLGFSFYTNRGETAYIPFISSSGKNFIREREALSVLKPVLESNDLPKIVNNLKFQYGLLKRYDIELAGMTFDITLESYVLNSLENCQDISRLADLYLRDKTVLTRSSQYCHIPVPDMEKKVMSASEKINVILRLHQELWQRIEKLSDIKKILEQIDTPMASVLSRIERTGVLVDENVLLFYSRELTRRLNELQIEAYHLVEETFNISSTKQLKRMLYEKQKLPVIKKTKKGEPSINEKVLTELALTHPLPNLILEYRSLAKLKSTYTDRLLRMIHPQSKRLHTSYHQNITATGRLSSSEPNLQNIPVRKEGRRIRQAFVAPQEFLLVSADYSQIELRIMAHLSGDISLRNAFYANEDIHRATASEIFDTPVNHVTSDQRRRAKVINFGLIYGMSYFGLAQKLSVSKNKAKKYMRCYFNRYPGVLNYMEEIRKKGRDQGYVSTLDGRRIYLPNIHSGNDRKKKGAERSAINATIQGTAADIIKRAMISVDRWLQRESPSARMIMQIHDELVFEIHKDILERALLMIQMLMERAFILDVPLIVEIRVGENWGELEHWNHT